MIEPLESLIDKQDTIEIVRDRVALILLQNRDRQMELAEAAGEDPERFRIRVFVERAAPWEEWLEEEGAPCTEAPIVNVSVESATYEQAGSTSSRTRTTGRIRLECFGAGFHAEDPAGGQVLGDERAALSTLRAARFCRNVLMAERYQLLGLRGLVGGRRFESLTMLHHEPLVRPVHPIRAAVLQLAVALNEHAPEFVGEPLEEIHVTLQRQDTGEVYLAHTFPVAAP